MEYIWFKETVEMLVKAIVIQWKTKTKTKTTKNKKQRKRKRKTSSKPACVTKAAWECFECK